VTEIELAAASTSSMMAVSSIRRAGDGRSPVAALAFAGLASRGPTADRGWHGGGVAAFASRAAVHALGERPPTPVDFWRGNAAGLLLERARRVNRPHSLVLW